MCAHAYEREERERRERYSNRLVQIIEKSAKQIFLKIDIAELHKNENLVFSHQFTKTTQKIRTILHAFIYIYKKTNNNQKNTSYHIHNRQNIYATLFRCRYRNTSYVENTLSKVACLLLHYFLNNKYHSKDFAIMHNHIIKVFSTLYKMEYEKKTKERNTTTSME